jgi:PAS domain S-box-containing protein
LSRIADEDQKIVLGKVAHSCTYTVDPAEHIIVFHIQTSAFPDQMSPLYRSPAFYQLLADSYARLLGRPLVPQAMPVAEATEWLYERAPFAVLAHNTDPDPLFIYGNRAAQRRFGYSWDEITRLPSRLSAEAPNREERQQFLERVQRLGYEVGYKGVRVTKSGERFMIEEATLWQLLDADGTLHGQAVVIPRTRDI